MADVYALSIDIGTSSIKSAVIDQLGEMISYARVDLPEVLTAAPWIEAFERGLSLLSRVEDCSGVCITGNGPTLAIMDEGPVEQYPVVSWMTERPAVLKDSPSIYLPRLVHARTTHGPWFTPARRFIGCPEFFTYLLTGSACTFLPSDEFRKFIWDEDQITENGFSPDQFPPFLRTGEQVGQVIVSAAERFGIPAGVPVFAGMTDFHAALLGCGVVHDGMTCDRAGTSEGINVLISDEQRHEGLRTLPNLIGGTWTLAGLMHSSGELFEWFRREARMDHVAYADLTKAITMSIPHHDYYFYPAAHDAGRGGFSDGGSCLDDPPQRGRTLAEGIGFTVRSILERFSAAGHQVDVIRHCGGQARSFHWNYMKSQILRIPIEVPKIIDAELLGCAAVSFSSLGLFSSLTEAADELVQIEHVYTPIQRTSIHYDSQYQEWKDHAQA